MANLFAVRVKEYGVEDEEIEMGTYSIAVPIWNYKDCARHYQRFWNENRMIITIEDDIIRIDLWRQPPQFREFGYIVPT